VRGGAGDKLQLFLASPPFHLEGPCAENRYFSRFGADIIGGIVFEEMLGYRHEVVEMVEHNFPGHWFAEVKHQR